MAEFNAKPLGVLDSIYRFVGGLRGTNRVALESPIQLVHDVSREASLGQGFLFERSQPSITVAAAATVGRTTVTRADLVSSAALTARLRELGLNTETVGIWLLGQVAQVVEAGFSSFTELAASIVLGGPNSGAAEEWITYYANTGVLVGGDPIAAGGNQSLAVNRGGPVNNPYNFNTLSFPIKLRKGSPDTTQNFILVTDGVAEVTANFSNVYWVGPAGSIPVVGS